MPRTQTNADQIFEKSNKISSLVWPLQRADFSFTHQREFKLGQCLGIDAITPHSKFGKVA